MKKIHSMNRIERIYYAGFFIILFIALFNLYQIRTTYKTESKPTDLLSTARELLLVLKE